MILMNLIRRVLALSAATAMATLVTVATSACGGATTATSAPTNGLEKKSPADVLQATAAALKAAKSVHIVGTGPDGYFDLRTQGSAATGTFAKADIHVKITIIDGDSYAKTNQAGLKAFGAPQPIRHYVGRWLKLPKQTFKDFALDRIASQLTTYYGPLEPKVRQATLNGKKVVVVS